MREKREWKIVEDFVHENVRCLIAKLQIGEEERSWASFGEYGYYQYNGYVVIPKGHRDYGIVTKSLYEFLKTHLHGLINERPCFYNPLCMSSLKSHNVDEGITRYKKGEPTDYNVHGGITFSDWGNKGSILSEGEWIIGFDTAHITDFEDWRGCGGIGWKKGLDYVKIETRKLAEQVARLGGE